MKRLLFAGILICAVASYVFALGEGGIQGGGGGGSTNADDLSSGTVGAARGGTNIDTSSSTGVPYVDNGTWGVDNQATFVQRFSGCVDNTDLLSGDGTCVTAVGTGDVVGPASATDGYFALWNNTTGKLLKDGFSSVNPAFNSINVTGTTGVAIGSTAVGGQGRIVLKSGVAANSNTFTIVVDNTSGGLGASLSWILPKAASGGANYLLNVDVDGTVDYTDPSTLGGDNLGAAAASDVVALFSGSGDYLKTDGTQGTPAGAGTVNGPAVATTDNVACWGADNTSIKDCGHAISAVGWGLIDDASVSDMRTTLGLAIGSDVLAPDGDGSSLTGITSGQVSGLGTMATQNKGAVDIEGGTIDNTPIGATTPSTGRFTTLEFDEATSTCVPASNNCGQTATNTTSPAGANLSAGLQWFDNTTQCFMIRNNDNTANITMSCLTKSFTFGIDNVVAVSDNNIFIWNDLPRAITITKISCTASADNVIGVLSECTAGDTTSCTNVDDTDWTIGGVTAATVGTTYDSGFENPGIAAGAYLKWITTSVGTTNSNKLSCTVRYTE